MKIARRKFSLGVAATATAPAVALLATTGQSPGDATDAIHRKWKLEFTSFFVDGLMPTDNLRWQ